MSNVRDLTTYPGPVDLSDLLMISNEGTAQAFKIPMTNIFGSSPDAGFAARDITSGDSSGSSVITAKFATIDVNIRGEYNQTTGVFTSSISGMYFFAAQLVAEDFDYKTNGGVIDFYTTTARLYDTYGRFTPTINENQIYRTFSIAGLAYLSAGQTVDLRYVNTGTSAWGALPSATGNCVFSGWLLKAF